MNCNFSEVTDLTDELKRAAEMIVDGWYSEVRIDWGDFIDRMEQYELEDGNFPDFGEDMDSPAIRQLKSHVRAYKAL